MANEVAKMTTHEVEEWLAIRKEAGLHINPETAEVDWTYELTLDPYGVEPEIPEEYQQIGRAYFARSPRKRRVGLVWRLARSDQRRLVGEALAKIGVSCRPVNFRRYI